MIADEKFKKIAFGVYGSQEYEYQGGAYNMLASFAVGLHKALIKKQLHTKYIDEYFEANLLPHISIGFNATGFDYWPTVINSGLTSIMWNVDSVFFNNISTIQKYHNFPNFSCFALSKDDDEPVKKFLPDLKTYYLPLAIDPEIWQSDSTEKTKDIVFLASIDDIEAKIQTVKDQIKVNPEMFDLFMSMYKYAMQNPTKNFWEIYSFFRLNTSDINFYHVLFRELTYLVSYQRRVDLIKYLANSGLNVEVWGNGPWEKYVGGNVKHMGSANLFDAIEIIKSAKIAINLQPMQILGGIHDRIMNSSAANTLVFTDRNQEIKKSYGDSVCHINMPNFNGLADKLRYYLENDNARIEKAKKAQQITLQKHTWDARVDEILANMKIQ